MTRTLEQDQAWARNRIKHFSGVATMGYTARARSYGRGQVNYWTARANEISAAILERDATKEVQP